MNTQHKPCEVATKAATTAARVILEHLPTLASTDPADIARAARLHAAVAQVLAAAAELLEQESANRGAALADAIAEGTREGFSIA